MKTHTETLIENYLRQAHQLSLATQANESNRDDLLRLIDQSLRNAEGDSLTTAFLCAEQAFYQHRYQEALEQLLPLRWLPQHHFYCYRASAFLSAQHGQNEKALEFAKQALALHHNDLETLHLCKTLSSGRTPDLDPVAAADQETTSPVGLATEEFDAITDIFRSGSTAEHPTLLSPQIPLPPKPITPLPKSESLQATTLESKIEAFLDQQRETLCQYLNQAGQQTPLSQALYVMNGSVTDASDSPWPVTQNVNACGGYCILWNGLGIVINPGKTFLQNFHRQGLHLFNIHCVVVTSEQPECYADIRSIYELNGRLNQLQNRAHVIHYYLHPNAHSELAPKLKPKFKQEAGTVHRLEHYLDSPDSESVALSDLVTMHYFKQQGDFVLRFDLQPSKERETSVHLGYISRTPWSSALVSHLSGCDIVIAGIEEISVADLRQEQPAQRCLGYRGTARLLSELAPRLLLCCEFDMNQGDIRLETIQQLRQEQGGSHPTTILPGDNGLTVDLSNGSVCCSVSGLPVDAAHVRVLKPQTGFGTLRYLSPDCLL